MKRKRIRFFLYLLLKLGIALLRLLPRSAALQAARGIGRAAFHIVPSQRKKVLANLRFAWQGGKSEKELCRIAQGVFENLAMTACDVILFPRLNGGTLRDWLEQDDAPFDSIDRILAQGKGVIIVTGHMGNWELLAAAYGVKGHSGAVIGRRIYYEPFNQVIVKLREGVGVRTIYRDESPRKMLQVLLKNQILGIVADQDVDSIEGTFVPFFGVPAYTPTAPAKLSIASGAPIVPAFMIRQGRKYRLFMEEPIYPEVKDSKEEAVQDMTARWAEAVEDRVRRFPEQWGWMHDRWKTRPGDVKKRKLEAVS